MNTTQSLSDLKTGDLVGRYFVGVVRDNTGSLGRCKVYVPGLLDNIEIPDLPWFTTIRPIHRGVSGNVGFFSIPRNETRVLVVFDNNDINSGIIIGEIADGQGCPANEVPNKWGFIDEAGTKIEVIVGETLTIHHKGTTILIQPNGLLQINVADVTNIVSSQPVNITAPFINLN
jgi:hypothetical protein